MTLFDFHCHFEELDRLGVLELQLAEARKQGIAEWLSSALCHDEYVWHQMQKIEGMQWVAGIHPYYEKSSEDDFDELVELCEKGQIYGIGEIGLDSRNPDEDWQNKILLKQLELAKDYELPVVFHTVKRYYQLHKLLKNNFPGVRGWLHGFNSSLEVVNAFSGFDIGFSINARMPAADVLRKIIARGLWQIETDAPYAKPYGCKEDINQLKNLIYVREKIIKFQE